MRRRGSSRDGKKLPSRSLGMRSSTSPALVESSRVRLPLRWVVRASLRSNRAAPIERPASRSMSSWITRRMDSRGDVDAAAGADGLEQFGPAGSTLSRYVALVRLMQIRLDEPALHR